MLYLPTSSLNFNNIFSSESISPISFYSKRNFGYKRFEAVEPNPFQNSILLYSRFPSFEIKDFEKDNYPIIFGIPKSIILDNIALVKSTASVDIFQLAASVYLNPFDIKVYFASESTLKTTLIKSESSLDTKLVSVYKSCFSIENSSLDKFAWNKNAIEDIKDLEEIENVRFIEYDKKVNRIKGFAYCYLIGANFKLPSAVLELKRLLKEIKNLSSGLINIHSNNSSTTTKSAIKKNLQSKDLINRLEKFNITVQRFIALANDVDPQKHNGNDLEKEELTKFGFSDPDITKVFNFLRAYRSGRYSLYEHFQWALQSSKQMQNSDNWINSFGQFASSINSLFSKNENTAQNLKFENTDKIFDLTDESILRIEKSYRNQNTKLNINEAFIIANLRLTSLTDQYLKRKTDFYKDLINTLIDVPLGNIEDFKLSKADITIICGKVLKENVEQILKKEWKSSEERSFINSLLDNIESHQPFNLKSHGSEVLQSFAAFIIKGEDPDKLMDFQIANSFQDFRLSLGLWGATFGFASLPRTLTESFFSVDSIYITSFIKTLSEQLFGNEISSNINLEIIKEDPLLYKNQNLSNSEEFRKVENKQSEILEEPIMPDKIEIAPSISLVNQVCPECGSEMKLKNGKYGYFYSCSMFPSCKGTRQIKEVVNNEERSNNLSVLIMEYIQQKGHSKISDLQSFIKAKTSISYNISSIEEYIKQNLIEEIIIKKKDKAAGIMLRDKGNLFPNR